MLSNLFVSSNKSSAAASVLLIGSCEELGVPITVYQVNHTSSFSVSLSCFNMLTFKLVPDNFTSHSLFGQRAL